MKKQDIYRIDAPGIDKNLCIRKRWGFYQVGAMKHDKFEQCCDAEKVGEKWVKRVVKFEPEVFSVEGDLECGKYKSLRSKLKYFIKAYGTYPYKIGRLEIDLSQLKKDFESEKGLGAEQLALVWSNYQCLRKAKGLSRNDKRFLVKFGTVYHSIGSASKDLGFIDLRGLHNIPARVIASLDLKKDKKLKSSLRRPIGAVNRSLSDLQKSDAGKLLPSKILNRIELLNLMQSVVHDVRYQSSEAFDHRLFLFSIGKLRKVLDHFLGRKLLRDSVDQALWAAYPSEIKSLKNLDKVIATLEHTENIDPKMGYYIAHKAVEDTVLKLHSPGLFGYLKNKFSLGVRRGSEHSCVGVLASVFKDTYASIPFAKSIKARKSSSIVINDSGKARGLIEVKSLPPEDASFMSVVNDEANIAHEEVSVYAFLNGMCDFWKCTEEKLARKLHNKKCANDRVRVANLVGAINAVKARKHENIKEALSEVEKLALWVEIKSGAKVSTGVLKNAACCFYRYLDAEIEVRRSYPQPF